jgi:hypothetical protein
MSRPRNLVGQNQGNSESVGLECLFLKDGMVNNCNLFAIIHKLLVKGKLLPQL